MLTDKKLIKNVSITHERKRESKCITLQYEIFEELAFYWPILLSNNGPIENESNVWPGDRTGAEWCLERRERRWQREAGVNVWA